MEEKIPYVPQLLQIGSAARNAGKTTVACSVLDAYASQYRIVALKIVTISGKRGVCQRGGSGCGVCTSIDGGYKLTQETRSTGDKDTARLLAAGATRVYFLRTFAQFLEEGFQAFLAQTHEDELLICESNSLRKYVRPGVFLMVDNAHNEVKPSARAVYEQADCVVKIADKNVVVAQPGGWCVSTKKVRSYLRG